MKKIKLSFWGFLVAMTGLWLWAEPLVRVPAKFYPLRLALINYTGLMTIGVMSVAIMLAVRPAVLESRLGGLDKMYRLHKWLGIAALVMAVAHWLWIKLPRWLFDHGIVAAPARDVTPDAVTSAFAFLRALRPAAYPIGEWSFYAVVLLIVLALLKWFPYRYFFKTHRLLAIAYLFLAFHSVVLMKLAYWYEAVAPALVMLVAAGSVAALLILFGKAGRSRQAVGVIDGATNHPDMNILEVAIRLRDRWGGHEAGQFAFVSFDDGEGPHPFTISSSWRGDGRMLFLIKELGDYTKTLPGRLKAGDLVRVEGPYGRFNFNGGKPRQIWISAGIGITPFLSRMSQLASAPDGKVVDLFHASSALDGEALQHLRRLRRQAAEANVRLHIHRTREVRLNAERICQVVPEWRAADVWFCGPPAFGQALRADFAARGLPRGDFHQELFQMR
jgi:predicted ferric reductase